MKKLLSRPEILLAASCLFLLLAIFSAYQNTDAPQTTQPVKAAMALPIKTGMSQPMKSAVQPAALKHDIVVTTAMLEKMVDAAPAPREHISRIEMSSHPLFTE